MAKLKTDSDFTPTFCVYPWMEFIVGPDKNARLCCIADGVLLSKSNRPYSLDKVSLNKIWNSEAIRDVRKKMLAGEKIKACSRCYYLEDIGQTSYRQIFNKTWLDSEHGNEIINRILKSKKNNFSVDVPPLYLDLRLGNKCNLQCRMCNPVNSSKIYQEQKELIQEKKDIGYLIDKSFLNEDDYSFHNWHRSPGIWKTISQWLPSIKKLYLTGGEPTLIKKNWELINLLQKKGYSKKITLEFNINCTYVPNALLDTFNTFKFVCLNLSIDGYGKVQEYIRHPSRWNILKKNILKILKKKTENVHVYFVPVVQVYNIIYLDQLLRWIDELQKEYRHVYHSPIFCTGPDYFDISILPQNVRDISLKRINSYQLNYSGHDRVLMESLETIKRILTTIRKKDSIFQLRSFFEYTSILDEKRGNSFKKDLPELYGLMHKEDSHIKNNAILNS